MAAIRIDKPDKTKVPNGDTAGPPSIQPKKIRLAGSPTLVIKKFMTSAQTPTGASRKIPVTKALRNCNHRLEGGGLTVAIGVVGMAP
jgi:hypothetical protein